MAKTRAQRKAEARRRAQQQQGRTDADLTEESRAQHDTQVGETGAATSVRNPSTSHG